MLSCCDADGEILSVPEFFAVGKTFRALFWCAVKGGGHCQFLNISVIYKVHLRRVPRPSVFINHLTLPKLMILHLVNCYLVFRSENKKWVKISLLVFLAFALVFEISHVVYFM